MRRIVVNLIVALSAILVVLIMLEIGFRLFVPDEFTTALVHVWDKDLALRQVPGLRGHKRTAEFATEIAINSRGLRDKDYPYAKPQGSRRILCLGDSFTFGYGVEADQTFADVLERALNTDGEDDGTWEVINAGVPGTGTAHQLAYFSLEGYKYDPDFVLLSFCGKNDFSDNVKHGIYSLSNGRLVKHDARLSSVGRIRRSIEALPGYRGIMTRSRLMMFVGHRLTSWISVRRPSGPQDPAAAAAQKQEAYNLTRALILGLRDLCLARGCQLVITVVPESDGGDMRDEVAQLVADVRAEGVAYLDLRSVFDGGTEPATNYFYAVDKHWNVSGHLLVAEALHGFFVKAAEGMK